MWLQSLGLEDPLVEKMATHSNILAWEIPWTKEPGRLHGVTRVGHNLATKPQYIYICMYIHTDVYVYMCVCMC